MNEAHSSAQREKPSVSAWQIPANWDESRALPLALCNGALSLTQVGKQRQHLGPTCWKGEFSASRAALQLLLKQGCICSSMPGNGKSQLEGIPALQALAVNLHFWRVPASNGSSDFPRGSK